MATKLVKKDSKKEVKKNTVATKGTKKNQETIVEGNLVENAPKHATCNTEDRTVGVSIGITKNMDNYESLRVDVWLTDKLQENETHAEGVLRLASIVNDQLNETVDLVLEAE